MSSSWYLLEIDLSPIGRRVESQEFRSALAALGDRVDPALFHYRGNGKTDTCPFPAFRISSTGRLGVVAAVGTPAVQYLVENGHVLTAGVAERFGIRRTAEYRSGGVTRIIRKPYGNRYLIPTLVFQRSRADYARFGKDAKKNSLSDEIKARIKGIIHRDILMHGDYLGLEVDPDFEVDEVEVERFCPIKVKGGRYNLAACGVRFRSTLLLQGIFNLGYLKSRGKGRVILMRDQTKPKKEQKGEKDES